MTTTATEQRAVAPTRWTVDPEDTSVEFAVKTFWGLTTVRGRFDRFDGSYEIGPDGTTIELTIDADSLDTGHANARRASALGPTSSTSPSTRRCASPRPASTRSTGDILHVAGHLEAAGKVVPLEFPATVRQVDGRARGRGDNDGRPAAARHEQRPARDDPPAGDAARQGTPEPMTERHRVVIVGGGFGGLAAAKALRRAPVDVIVVDRQAHHLFQPLLYQVATGVLSQGNVAPPLRDILRHQATRRSSSPRSAASTSTRRIVSCTLLDRTWELAYDSLIVAAGSAQSYFGHDEFAVHAPGMKTIDDALEVRGRIFGAFELAELEEDAARRAAWLTFVVVGAGPTGVEMAGQIAELSRYSLRSNFRRIDTAAARIVLRRRGAADPAELRRAPRAAGGGEARADGRRDQDGDAGHRTWTLQASS